MGIFLRLAYWMPMIHLFGAEPFLHILVSFLACVLAAQLFLVDLQFVAVSVHLGSFVPCDVCGGHTDLSFVNFKHPFCKNMMGTLGSTSRQ